MTQCALHKVMLPHEQQHLSSHSSLLNGSCLLPSTWCQTPRPEVATYLRTTDSLTLYLFCLDACQDSMRMPPLAAHGSSGDDGGLVPAGQLGHVEQRERDVQRHQY